MNNYPPQLPPPSQGGYNPFNPYQGYDPNADYVPWLPGRQSPRFLPIVIVVGALLICSCCAFLFGVVVGIELPGFLAPSNSEQPNNSSNNEPQPQDEAPPEESAPQNFQWRVIYPNT